MDCRRDRGSSALLAIILGEPDAALFATAIVEAPKARIATPNWVEVALVIDARADEALRACFDDYADAMCVAIIPFLPEHATQARLAWQRFGCGRHPAKLNYRDCTAYGVAKAKEQRLLFKGSDFALIDIEPALRH
jgi:ribonuclease VapC